MNDAAKRKSSLAATLAVARLLLLLVVACCGLETRVGGLAATPQLAPSEVAFATPSFIEENYDGALYDASHSLVAAKTGGQPLFRAVTDAELQSIQNLNRFSTVPGSSTPIPGVQGKWFYSNLEDAQRWAGQAAARDGGPLHIIRTSVPESVSPAWSQAWVDGIQNPALFHRLENLNGPITVIPPPIP
jgi:hypothetical protein